MIAAVPERTHIRHLCGRAEILLHQDVLQQFAALTEQHAAMHGLEYTLENEYARRKTPHLFCVVRGDDNSAPLTVETLVGCVLHFEYRLLSRNTGIFASGDSTGVRTLIAPPALRVRVAAAASCAALGRARIVLTTFRSEWEEVTGTEFPGTAHGLWAAHRREVRDYLPLASTYDLTLATLGKRTRTHLRYYRKRLQAATGCIFETHAASHLSPSDLAKLNAGSLEPLPQHVFDRQYNACVRDAGGYVCGLRTADGRWISLAGGWRQGAMTLVQWQTNVAGFTGHSLSTAFRAFLIEHEISLGSQRLCFHNSTSHSMHHAFVEEHVTDLLLRRSGLIEWLLVGVVPFVAERRDALATRGNFLVDALLERSLRWKPLPGGF